MTQEHAVTPEKAEGTERTEGESGIDYQIRMTKKALSLSNITVESPKKGKDWTPASLEFGGNANLPIFRRYLWLVAKLITLYLVKGLRWIIRLPKNFSHSSGKQGD